MKSTFRYILFVLFVSGFFVFGLSDIVKATNGFFDRTSNAEMQALAAQYGCGTMSPGFSPKCPAEIAAELAKRTNEALVKPTIRFVLVKALLNLTDFVTKRLAYEAAMYIANGGAGQGSMFYKKSPSDAWHDLGKEIAGEAIANLNDVAQKGLGTTFNLCTPNAPMLRLNLQIGIKQAYTPDRPRCNWDDIKDNWDKVTADTMIVINDRNQANNTLLNRFATSLRPGSNELGGSIGINIAVANEVAQKQNREFQERLASINVGNVKNVTNFITGNVETPASLVQKDFEQKIMKSYGDQDQIKAADLLFTRDNLLNTGLLAASTFTNTLTSQLLNKLRKGLFENQPDEADPLNVDMIALTNGLDANKKSFSGVFASSPISVSEFDALGEFVVCPAIGATNRELNNCVLDSDFASALTRGNSGSALTVQEAIDQKMLKGDWPLISSKNTAANQDSLCYTYGYCYGNLVKLRKARVLPVGWEMAANKNSTVNPKSLKEIVSAFNDCSAQGTADAAHPWCHLIDPNWVLKAPQAQCRATVNGEIRVGSFTNGRQSYCADSPTCIGEDNVGNCTQGYGYCVEEKNVWRVKGDECPEFAATCLALNNTTTGKQSAYLVNTVDYSVCNQNNAGCAWYKTQKHLNTKGTADTKDDEYDWLMNGETFTVAQRSDDNRYQIAGNATSSRVTYTSGGLSYQTYSNEDQMYLTHQVKACDQQNAGCSELVENKPGVVLNLLQNASFENDVDKDGKPDQWVGSAKSTSVTDTQALDGSVSLGLTGAANEGVSQVVSVTPGNFYTVSYYASTKESNVKPNVFVTPLNSTGGKLNLDGFSYSLDTCTLNGDTYEITDQVTKDNGWKRFTCTFALPKDAAALRVGLLVSSTGTATDLKYDNIQLEAGENASAFTDGYSNKDVQKTYLKIPPAYLGCKGLPSDPKECASYAQVCSAADVGCNLYTPKETGPNVPAIVSDLDRCPNECVGYDTYKQEATKYESSKFPLYFIPSSGKTCSQKVVGCDGFTNIGSSAETQEYYTNLRSCATPEMMTSNGINPTSATYYTWEGSDKTGYQLRTWSLLKATGNAVSGKLTFAQSTFEEKNPENAPCVKPNVKAPGDVVECNDTINYINEYVVSNGSCDEHTDIYTNPDCREFFDKDGNVHYRLFSDTVTIDAACTAYRKNTSTKSDCDASGGFWTEQGFCRYYGLKKESSVCSAEENGCRAFTGGAGRNSSTIFEDTFENGTTANFEDWKGQGGATTISVSNDSVAAGGRSMSVKNQKGNNDGIQTVANALNAKLVRGKTYSVSFWAKGTGSIYVGMQDKGGIGAYYDLVDPKNTGNLKAIPLDTNWKVFTVGPINTSEDRFKYFDQTAVLFFFTDGGNEFNLDNIRLIQGEENITLIKDSWGTPAVCDQSPSGAQSPQYYLGCKAYTDQKGKDTSVYQFSRVCSEKGVGCSAYYNTQNSDSPYGSVNNARCVNAPALADLPNGKTVTSATDCKVNGVYYCTILVDHSYCVFSTKTDFQDPLPYSAPFGIVYGAETVINPADKPVYVVDNGSSSCTEAFKGCREVGVPTYAQDLKTVTAFKSAYVMDDPSSYDKILCENEALFCDEFASNKDGKFYFKDPLDKTCEYKTSVTVNNKSYSGWFKSGTSEPCYSSYVIGGHKAAMWKNGDAAYEGWVGMCDAANDRCTEFTDTTDTGVAGASKGKSYFVVNNQKLEESNVSDAQKCEGKVSQKAGCVLFENTTVSQLKYNQNASYVVSSHADLLLNKEPNIPVDPVNCSTNGGGLFTVNQDAQKKIGLTTNTIDVCQSRCEYTIAKGDVLLTPSAKKEKSNDTGWLERSCVLDSDCPELTTKYNNSQKVSGTCNNVLPVTDRLLNDANTVMKVARDRTCSEWLACDSARTSWDPNTNQYIQLCDSVALCDKGSAQGKENACQNWTSRTPVIFSDAQYSARDTTWNGRDYSGFQIPNQLPVELYTQFNLAAQRVCKDNSSACTTDVDCLKDNGGGKCIENTEKDYRLVYNAGPCKLSYGASCRVGHCSGNPQTACGTAADCPKATDTCVIGYCQAISQKSCTSDTDCSGAKAGGTNTNICDTSVGVCVDTLLGKGSNATSCESKGNCGADQSCVTSVNTIKGVCLNDRCIADIKDKNGDGFTDAIDLTNPNTLEPSSCRGYPEMDSPFPSKVVTKWKTTKNENNNTTLTIDEKPTSDSSQPFEYVSGYKDAKTCTSTNGEASDACLCDYTKVEYGKGTQVRYYGTTEKIYETNGVCVSGKLQGNTCSNDSGCTIQSNDPKDVQTGQCEKMSSKTAMYGWKGYCLERDSSIQINGSNKTEDQVCLSWLPVDQLSGSTDLYGKEVQAGFVGDAYYCADVVLGYNLVRSSIACAEAYFGCGNDSDDDEDVDIEDFEEDKAHEHLVCPKHYFAIIDRGCGGKASREGNHCEETFGDDDYAYFCVPENAKHTKAGSESSDENVRTINAQVGSWCEKPDEDKLKEFIKSKSPSENNTWDIKKYTRNEIDIWVGFYAYQLFKAYYSDCVVNGVVNLADYGNPQNTSSGSDDADYRYLDLNLIAVPVCKSLVQTSSSSLVNDGSSLERYNTAWTNRIWESQEYKLNASNEKLNYSAKTEISPFGAALDPVQINTLKDPGPDHIAFCGLNQIPNADLTCKGDNKIGLNQARTYGVFGISWPDSILTSNTKYCKHSSCVCEPPNDGSDCNIDDGDKIYCKVQSGDCVNNYNVNVGTCNDQTEVEDCKEKGNECIIKGQCKNGPLDGSTCTKDMDCFVNECKFDIYMLDMLEYRCVDKSSTAGTLGQINSYSSANARALLQQIFAQGLGVWDFDETVQKLKGTNSEKYTLNTDSKSDWLFDSRKSGSGTSTPKAPTVVSVGNCVGTSCYEKAKAKFTINGYDDQMVVGVMNKRVSASFYAYADSNQMPIRRMTVDWGADFDATGKTWGFGSQSGSQAGDNFYKNYRGKNTTTNKEYCEADTKDFGLSPQACSSSYVSFTKDYVCSPQLLKSLQDKNRTCEYRADGKTLKFSPCVEKDSCVFQPRVNVMDNWGWCTGSCPGGEDGTNGCFEGKTVNECDVSQCPGGDKCKTSADPWIYYEGVIKIKSE